MIPKSPGGTGGQLAAPKAVKVNNAVSKVTQTIRTMSKTVSAATIASTYRATTSV